MITAITGKPGFGKTWLMSEMAHADVAAGERVAINYALLTEEKEPYCVSCDEAFDQFDPKTAVPQLKDGSCPRHGAEAIGERYKTLTDPNLTYWRDMGDLKNFKKGTIYIDEGQIFFNSRNWENLPLELQYKLQLHRHDALNIVLTTQNIKRIDVIVRELVQEFYHMEKMIGLGNFQIFRRTEYDTDEITQEMKTVIGTKYYFANWGRPPRYDTLGKIPLPMKRGYTREFIKCSECGREHPVR